MRLLNLNIAIFIDNVDKVIDLIKQLKPDIVCLQEVVRHIDPQAKKQHHNNEQFEEGLEKEYPYNFFGPVWITDAHRGLEKGYHFGGLVEMGNHTMSKFLITKGYNSFFYGSYSFDYDWSKWYELDHARAVVITDLKLKDGNVLRVLNNHGCWSRDKIDTERSFKECQHIKEQAEMHPGPVIIAGDFNVTPETKSIEILNENFINLNSKYKINTTLSQKKWKEGAADKAIDYIFVNEKISVKKFEVIDSNISDHCPMIVDFTIK